MDKIAHHHYWYLWEFPQVWEFPFTMVHTLFPVLLKGNGNMFGFSQCYAEAEADRKKLSEITNNIIRPNKKIPVFPVTWKKKLGSVGR